MMLERAPIPDAAGFKWQGSIWASGAGVRFGLKGATFWGRSGASVETGASVESGASGASGASGGKWGKWWVKGAWGRS